MSRLVILRRATVPLVFAVLAIGLVTSSAGSAFGPTVGRVPEAEGAQLSKPTGPRVSHRKRDQLSRQPDGLPGHSLQIRHDGRALAIVAFAPHATTAEVTAFLRDFAATIADGPDADGLYRIRLAPGGSSVAKTIQSMRARKAVVVSVTDA